MTTQEQPTRADLERLITRLRAGCEYDPNTRSCSQARWQAAKALEGAVEEVGDLVAKLSFLVKWADDAGYLPDHVFTFPDGDTWGR